MPLIGFITHHIGENQSSFVEMESVSKMIVKLKSGLEYFIEITPCMEKGIFVTGFVILVK